MVRQWLLAVVVLFVGQVGAVEYYWVDSRYHMDPNMPRYSSADEACNAICDGPGATRVRFEFTSFAGGLSNFCKFIDERGSTYCSANTTRRGDSCEKGRVWNAVIGGCRCPEGQQEDETGICVEPPCDEGLELLTRGSNFPATTVSGRVYVLSSPPSTVCSAGCQYSSASSKAASCYLIRGSTDTGFCNYSMTSDGSRCSGDDAPGPDVGDPPNPDSPPDSPTQPTDPDDPGCLAGQAWSGTACVAEPTGDGDEGGGADDGEDDDSGDPCDVDGDCWDEDDGNGGSGNGSGSGSGSGDDGSGDGEGDDGEGECDPSKGYVCGGGKGPESGLNTPDAGSWDKANEEWGQRLDEAKKELKDKVKANVDQMKSAFNLQLAAGGGQLPCDSISVWGKSYRFCVADYGEQLINLRLALLLMAAVIAALIILKD